MSQRNNWTHNELVLAVNLYCKLPFGKLHHRNPQIILLAEYIGRTPSAVAMKLANFATLDPTLEQKGLSACSALDKQVWNDYFSDENLTLWAEEQSEIIYSKKETETEIDYSAVDSVALVKSRCLQSYFRKTILADYNGRCCLTGISIPQLLVASHIIPWSQDKMNRLNPQNGLCLNALHDKAFDQGLITFDSQFRMLISPKVERATWNALLLDYEGQQINFPKKFAPSPVFMKYHRENIFRQ